MTVCRPVVVITQPPVQFKKGEGVEAAGVSQTTEDSSDAVVMRRSLFLRPLNTVL